MATYTNCDRLIADLERNQAIRELREEIVADRMYPHRPNVLAVAFWCSVLMVGLIWLAFR